MRGLVSSRRRGVSVCLAIVATIVAMMARCAVGEESAASQQPSQAASPAAPSSYSSAWSGGDMERGAASASECCKRACMFASNGTRISHERACSNVPKCIIHDYGAGCCSGGCSCRWVYSFPVRCQAASRYDPNCQCMGGSACAKCAVDPCKSLEDYATNGTCQVDETPSISALGLLLIYYGLPFAVFGVGLHLIWCVHRLSRRRPAHTAVAPLGALSVNGRNGRPLMPAPLPPLEFGPLRRLAVNPPSDSVVSVAPLSSGSVPRTGGAGGAVPFALRIRGEIIPATVWKEPFLEPVHQAPMTSTNSETPQD